jgi:hypothetical protein
MSLMRRNKEKRQRQKESMIVSKKKNESRNSKEASRRPRLRRNKRITYNDSMHLLDHPSFLIFLREHHRTRSASAFRTSQLGSSQEHRFPKKRQERLVGPCLRGEFLTDTRTIDKEDRAGSVACVPCQERERIVS